MNVKELYKYLDSAIPSSLSCSWDNDGLMCAPDSAREVKRVLVKLPPNLEKYNSFQRCRWNHPPVAPIISH